MVINANVVDPVLVLHHAPSVQCRLHTRYFDDAGRYHCPGCYPHLSRILIDLYPFERCTHVVTILIGDVFDASVSTVNGGVQM